MKATLPIAVALLVASCGEKQAPPPPQPLPVTVAKPDRREVTVFKTFPATLEGLTEIEIRARVRGTLEKKSFDDGTVVESGSELFTIEQEPFEAALSAARAGQANSEAALGLAEARRDRLRKAAKGAVSELDVEIAEAEVKQAAASVESSKASVRDAEINLSYTTITAAITGRMSEAFVDVGNLVGGAEPTLLATIIDDSEMYAYFEVPERAMIKYLGQRSMEGGIERFRDKQIRLELADGTVHDQPGRIDFISNRIDPATRTAKVRAVFPNPEARLSSGLYGLIGFPAGPDPDSPDEGSALLVPSVAILRDLGGDFVWIVDETNTVRRRGVETGDSVVKPDTDSDHPVVRETVILKGLEGDEQVIVSGLQRAREGAVVAPQTAE